MLFTVIKQGHSRMSLLKCSATAGSALHVDRRTAHISSS